MRTIPLFVSMILLLAACGSGTDHSFQTDAEDVDVHWVFDAYEDAQGVPQTRVALSVNEQIYPIDEAPAIEPLEPASWADYKIPATALLASGGWWAGGGNYYYVQRAGDYLEVMVGYNDEGMEPDAAYQYQMIRRISISEGGSSVAAGPGTGPHCFAYQDDVLTLDVELNIDDAQQVTGSQQGVIADEAQGYYTSYESALTGRLEGTQLRLQLITQIEGDTQEEDAVWTWEEGLLNDGQHVLEAVPCPNTPGGAMLGAGIGDGPAVGHCASDERALFSCPLDGSDKVVSLCASPDLTPNTGYLQYRFGLPGQVELVFPEDLTASQDAFLWQTIGYSGGWDTRLQFTNGGITYQLYDQAQKVSMSEKDYLGGVRVKQDGVLLAHLQCTASSLGPEAPVNLGELYELVPEGDFLDEGD